MDSYEKTGPGSRARKVNDPIDLRYLGQTGEVFLLWLKILALSIVTLGLYRFWGITAYRRYLWNHMTIDGDPLVYDGTGRELFVRFLMAFGILMGIVFVPWGILSLCGLVRAAQAWSSLGVFLFYLLTPVALYASRRYRISRTVWRGIRGSVGGSVRLFALHYHLRVIMAGVTLSIGRVWLDACVWNYPSRQTAFGDWRMLSRIRGGWFVGRHIGTVFAGAVFIGLAFATASVFEMVLVTIAKKLAIGESAVTVAIFLGAVTTGAFILAAIFLAGSIYHSKMFNLRARCSRIGKVRFGAGVETSELFLFRFVNLLIMAITLGTGQIFVQHRTFAFLARHVRLYGRGHLAALTQKPSSERPKAEGLALVLDLAGEGFVG